MVTKSQGWFSNSVLPTPSRQQEGPGAFVMFEDDIDLERLYGMPSAASLGLLVQIVASDGKVSTTHDLLDCFSDGIHDLGWAINDLQMLGFVNATSAEVDGMATVKLKLRYWVIPTCRCSRGNLSKTISPILGICLR